MDSGATATYVSKDLVSDYNLPTRALRNPIYALNADDTMNASAITREAKLTCSFQGHTFSEWFFVTDIGDKPMIIGMTWLRTHNPEIDWKTGAITFSRCPSTCHGNRSISEVLSRELETASTDTNYPSSVYQQYLAQVNHQINVKETTSMRWSIEALKDKEVLTLEDIKTGPFAEFADIFEEANYQELPPHRLWDHKIELTDDWETKKWKPHTYPLSYKEQEELDKFLEENLANGRIRRSESPLASPVFFINKKDGKKRMVIDYRKLNDITIKNVYPLPRIDELIQKWKGCIHFSALDIRSGYYNVRMKEGDEWKTAFITNRGLFESLVMTFGLCNAPATFQAMMDSIFIVQIRRGDTGTFIDDLGIGTGKDPRGILSPEEFHIAVVKEVFKLCREHKLFLKAEKCILFKPEIPYLGHYISGTGLRPDPVKLSGIKEWPVPTSVSTLRAYLGIMSYYRRFIQDFSTIARPLNDLLRKDTTFKWEKAQQDAYQQLKDKLLNDAFLLHPDNEKQFILETDASAFAWGAVLSQQDDKGVWRPVGCISKGFADAETRYDTHDRELLSIVRALEAFRHWLMGTKFPITILNDHNNLQYFKTKQKLSARQARWMQFLANFNFQLRYRPGRQSNLPDKLSRRADLEPEKVEPEEQVILPATVFDPQENQRINSLLTKPLNQEDFGKKILRAQAEDPLILGFNTRTESQLRSKEFGIPDGWQLTGPLWTFNGKIYIPSKLHAEVFQKLHTDGPAAHPGGKATLNIIRNDYYWPKMRDDIELRVKRCHQCQTMKNRNQRPHGELKPIEPAPRFWGIVTTDLVTGLPLSNGFDAIVTFTDKRGKMKHLAPTTSALDTAGFAQLFLDNVWKRHGTADKIITDRGPQMSSKSFKDICGILGIELALSTAYHPQTDGQSERTNQEVEQALRTVVSKHQDDWAKWLPVVEFALNNRYHTGLKTTPFYANYGYHPHIGSLPRIQSPIESVEDFVSHLHQVQKDTEASLIKASEDMKKFYDRHRNKTPEFQVGDKVLLDSSDLAINRPSRKLMERYSGPFEITEKVGTHAYRLKLPLYWKNVHPVWNVSKIFPYHEDPSTPNHPEPPPDVIEGEPEWEVESIVDSRFLHGKLQYLVKWTGWSDAENSWEDEANLEHSPDVIQDFYKKFPSAPRRLPDGSKSGKAITKRQKRGRKRIGCLEHEPMFTYTDVQDWPIGPMTRDESI